MSRVPSIDPFSGASPFPHPVLAGLERPGTSCEGRTNLHTFFSIPSPRFLLEQSVFRMGTGGEVRDGHPRIHGWSFGTALVVSRSIWGKV